MIRRAGKNSAEGVALSMAQWYPKMAEYDMMDGMPSPILVANTMVFGVILM